MCASKDDHVKIFESVGYGKTKICKQMVEYGAYLPNIAEDEMENSILKWKEAYGKQQY